MARAPVASATTVRPSTIGNTQILVYSINSDGPNFRSVVTGTIGDFGPAATVFPDGKVDPSHSSELDLKLTRGSIRLDVSALDKAFVVTASHEPIYSRTCSDSASVMAAAPIVKRSGTGSYVGIGGSFKMTATLSEVEETSCNPGSPANFRWQVISLTTCAISSSKIVGLSAHPRPRAARNPSCATRRRPRLRA